MRATTQNEDRPSRALLIAALDALDHEGDPVAAAYVSLALHRVEGGHGRDRDAGEARP